MQRCVEKRKRKRSKMVDTLWEIHLKAALFLVMDLRMQAIVRGIDPRALRVALKYALMVDTHCMQESGLTLEEEQKLTEIAKGLFRQTPQIQRG